jgi:hypothetical protein
MGVAKSAKNQINIDYVNGFVVYLWQNDEFVTQTQRSILND